MTLRLVSFDDAVAAAWEPFALTRPAGELLFGASTLRGRMESALGARCAMHLASEHLCGFEEAGAPAVRSYADAPADGPRLFLSSRAVLGATGGGELDPHLAAGPVTVGGHVAGWFAPAGELPPPPEWLRDPSRETSSAVLELPGRVLEHVWQLVLENPEQTTADILSRFPDPPEPSLPDGVYRLGARPLVQGDGVQVEPGVVFDTREGPIWLDDGVTVRAFTRLAGPAYVGPGSAILGGSLEAVSLGPGCKVRGEVAESVCLGYVNKAHDGHLGHAYLGRWVNLGAETTNSDLKNNYGTVRLPTPRGDVDTGSIKMGCLLGDHVKTGIGLLLNTGTVVGAGSNLFGAEMPPRHVPPFSWGSGADLTAYRLEKFLEVAERAMARRGVELSEEHRAQLAAAWHNARG